MFIYFSLLAAGLLYVIVTIVVGAWLAKKFDFSFAYFSILSIIVYLGISYTASSMLSPMAGITIVGIIGLFEAVVGLKLMVKMGIEINTELDDIDEDIMDEEFMDEDHNPHPSIVLMMILAYMFIGWIGSLMVG